MGRYRDKLTDLRKMGFNVCVHMDCSVRPPAPDKFWIECCSTSWVDEIRELGALFIGVHFTIFPGGCSGGGRLKKIWFGRDILGGGHVEIWLKKKYGVNERKGLKIRFIWKIGRILNIGEGKSWPCSKITGFFHSGKIKKNWDGE